MSVANDGISRFVESTVYAPVNFKGDVIASHVVADDVFTPLISAGALPLVLKSESLIQFGGSLLNQDVAINAAGAFVMDIDSVGIDQVWVIGAAVNIVLPEISSGVGVPSGTRLRFVTSGAGTVTFQTSIASASTLVYYVTGLVGGVLENKFQTKANNVQTPAYPANSIISVYSVSGTVWNIQGATYTVI